MSLSCFRSKRSFGAAVLLLGLAIGGCVSKACPDGQKLQSGKCVPKGGASHAGDEDAATPEPDGATQDAAAASDAGIVASDADVADAHTADAAPPCDQAQPPLRCWQDDDHDGYAAGDAASMSACGTKCPTGWTGRDPVSDDVDCNDSDANIRPRHCWRDNDLDGYADDARPGSVFCGNSCSSGWTATEPEKDAVDCDDSSAYFNPDVTETCNGKDNDCDGKIDEGTDEMCARTNAAGVCMDGTCKFTCKSGFGDCDKSPIDGCEHALNTADHCGACGTVCDVLATCDATKKDNIGACHCHAPSFGDGTVCHGPGPIASGWRATCATNGVYDPSCWGVSSTATAIPSGKYQQLSIGPVVGCGITTKGSLVCWGATIVPDETKFIQVVVGNDYVCALSSEQSVTCWGFGSKPAAYGEASPPNENFVQLAGGFYHACGLRSDGTAVCWGAGAYGRTADCEASGYDCGQAQAPADDRFVQLGAGMVHTCGLKADGTVKCWGAGVTSGTEASALKYGQATPPVDARFASISSGYLHNCGIRQSDGTVLCWGAGEANGSSSYDQHQSVPTDDHFLVLSAGLLQTCGLTTSYEIVCWGSATDGAPASVDGNWPLNPGH